MDRNLILFLEVAAYFIFIIFLGVISKKWVSSMSDFFTSGRELSVLAMSFGLAGIMFSRATLPTISGFAITHSLWIGSLYMWGWAAGIVFFGKVFAPAIRRSGVITLPEWTEVRFDERTRSVVAVATSMAAFGALFAQVVGLGNNVTAVTGIPYWATTLGVVILCTVYMYMGGFWALSITDISHMSVVMIAFAGVLGYLFFTVGGGPADVLKNSPGAASRVMTFLGDSPKGFMTSFKYPSFPSLLFGWAFTQMGCQYYWMRAVGGRSEKAVKKGYYWSGALTILFGSTMLALFGIYALYMFGEDSVTSANAFGMIIKKLPIGLDGLLLVALVAGAMSTFSTALLGVSSPITRDIYQRIFAPKANAKQLTRASRLFTLIIAVIAYVFALLWKQGSGHALAVMWAFSCPTAAVVLLGYLWNRVTVKAAFWSELLGLIITLGWYIAGLSSIVHPMWVGFGLTFVLVILITLFTKPKYYAKEGFKPGEPSTKGGLAQSGALLMKQYQDEQFKEAMRNTMRPILGTRKWKERVEKHRETNYTLADFMFPHITGRRLHDVPSKRTKKTPAK